MTNAEAIALDAARAGDDRAFQQLVGAYERELQAHCYRMLGSTVDAEDALQDALVRAWRGLAGFAGRSSLRTWLYKITTNACLALLERRRRDRRVLPLEGFPGAGPDGALGAPLTEEPWLGPFPDALLDGDADAPAARYERREAVELAFVVAVQHLPPNQRAVLLLRDVLGFRAREVAEVLETSVASVTSALQRARATLAERLPARSQQSTLRMHGDARVRALVDAYVDAWERGDPDAIIALLAADATFSMPPYAAWFRGHAPIARFLVDEPLQYVWRHIVTAANGQPAIACYRWSDDDGAFVAASLDVLDLTIASDGAASIGAVTAFLDAAAVLACGLPDRFCPSDSARSGRI